MARGGKLNWGVAIAAGGLVRDPLASALGTPRKALAPVSGRASLTWTLDAVQGAGFDTCVVVSGEDVQPHMSFGELVLEAETQMQNAKLAVDALADYKSLLFLPADSPLLLPEHLEYFVKQVESRVTEPGGNWFAVGVTTVEEFKTVFPRFEVQPIHLKDGSLLSGALYAASRSGFLHALEILQKMSESRKNQLAMLLKLGPWTVLRYLLHRVTIAEAETRIGKLLNGQAVIVEGCDPRTVADIDEVADYDEIRIFSNLGKGAGS